MTNHPSRRAFSPPQDEAGLHTPNFPHPEEPRSGVSKGRPARHALIIAAAAVLLGFAWRQRGGADWFVTDYTTVYRMAWALPYALVVTAYADWRGMAWRHMTPMLFLAAWVMLLNGHAEHMDMGEAATNDNVIFGLALRGEMLTFWLPNYAPGDPMWVRAGIDFLGMAVIAALRGAILALPFLIIERRAIWILPLAGPVAALGYLIGWNRTGGFGWLPDAMAAVSPNLAFPTAIGEFTTGAAYGAAGLAVIALAARRRAGGKRLESGL